MFSKKIDFEQTAGAILYPDRIIVETRNVQIQYSLSFYSTDNLTILKLNTSNNELGEAIIAHLNYSKMEGSYSKELRKNYLKILKFKSETAARKDSRYVSIFKSNSSIRFEPRNNKVSDGRSGAYYGMPNEIFEIKLQSNMDALGIATRNAWSKCIFS